MIYKFINKDVLECFRIIDIYYKIRVTSVITTNDSRLNSNFHLKKMKRIVRSNIRDFFVWRTLERFLWITHYNILGNEEQCDFNSQK